MFKPFVQGTLRFIAGTLRSKLIDYKVDISKHKPIIEKVMKDGYITDEETADLLEHIADNL